MHVDDSVVAEAKQAGKDRQGGVPEALRQLLIQEADRKRAPERLLDKLITLEKALEKLKEALATDVSDLHGWGRKFGPACPMPSAIPVAVALLKEEPDFRTGVRQNILVSGDNAGRSIWLGTVLAAANGLGGAAGVPLDWMSQVKGLKEIMEMVGDSSLFSER